MNIFAWETCYRFTSRNCACDPESSPVHTHDPPSVPVLRLVIPCVVGCNHRSLLPRFDINVTVRHSLDTSNQQYSNSTPTQEKPYNTLLFPRESKGAFPANRRKGVPHVSRILLYMYILIGPTVQPKPIYLPSVFLLKKIGRIHDVSRNSTTAIFFAV